MAIVEVQRSGDGIAVVTLNDPDRRNTMTLAMGDALQATFRELAEDAELRVAVLTGVGRAFSGGGDLAMLEEHAASAREGLDTSEAMRGFYARFLAVRDLPVPVIAAVNGHAVGAGFCVALACDLVVVATEAKVGLNFARLGIHPGMGGSWLLPRLAGPQRSAELLYTGRLVGGDEAVAAGLALEALPAEQVLPRALALAAEIAASAPLVVREMKASLRETWTRTLDEQLAAEAAFQAADFATDDVQEGLTAARERRAARFTGR